MIICGLDFETTGLDPDKDRVVETGLVLWDTELHAPIKVFGELVRSDVRITPEITAINGITNEMLEKYGADSQDALGVVNVFITSARVICAHNGNRFDRLFYVSWMKRSLGLTPHDWIWIDTCTDLGEPLGKLGHEAADRGFINPFPHRAVTDVLTMLRILDPPPAPPVYDLNEVVRVSQIPNVRVQAMVSYEDRELAKTRGYRWDGMERSWTRTVKEDQVKKEIAEAGFKVKVLA